ncbi:MAG: Ni/Fe hydrogenase subunit alpha, partial [Gemmataceae bacterium]
TINLDDAGKVADARFHVTEFRGFERFCVGRPFHEMPGLTARVCGICPVSHILASSRAGDRLLAVTVPPAGEKLRRLMNLAQITQSHALSFFHLSGPDLILGWESDPAGRNVFGLIAADRELARGGIRLRQFGQEIIESLGGRKIHPAWSVPGGVREPLSAERRDHILARLPEARATALHALAAFKGLLDRHRVEAEVFGNFPSLFLGLVTPEGGWEHHDGLLRFVDAHGEPAAADIDPQRFHEYIGEAVEHDSYLKTPYFKPLGYPGGMYRVGPLARLNVCDRIGTPLADAELAEYRQRGGRAVNASFFYHYARLIEVLAATEFIERLLADPDLVTGRTRANASINALEAVGVSEAPRGTLFHRYKIDENGLLTSVNLIIATGQNALAMNATVTQIAKHYVTGTAIPEPVLNRVEAGIRAFDPCLSCSTHAAGQMPLLVKLVDAGGRVIDEVRR